MNTVPADANDSYALSIDAFVRAVGVNRDIRHALFLGAGASITSGVPSAETCIWQWKRDVVVTNNPGLERQFEDASLPGVRARIQQWLDSQGGFPPQAAPEEYGFYVERAYPIAQDRRRYFQRLTEGAAPFIGYQLLCLLAEAELFDAVWTTNFDGLVPRAAATAPVTVIEVGLDTAERVARLVGKRELLHVALHGDYRYDALKNTPAELQAQDGQLRASLVASLPDSNLIVVGYSGRDDSIMDALRDAYAQRGAGRLYWCGRESTAPAVAVRELLATARASGHEAFYVPTEGFDDLMGRLALHCLVGEQKARAAQLRSKLLATVESPAFRVDQGAICAVAKSNASPVELPSEVLQLDAPNLTVEGAWGRLRERTAGTAVVAVPMSGKVLALGTVDGVREAFRGDIQGEVQRVPLNERELGITNGIVVSLLTGALTRGCGGGRTGDRWA